MRTYDLRPFAERDLDGAARLLAARHERHREARPLLPATPNYRAEVEELWRRDATFGVAADAPGGLVGYLIAWSRSEERWGPNVWVEPAGHAAVEAEVVRDLYAHAAARWVDQGLKAHYVLVPATDAPLVDAWFRLGFGAQAALGILALEGAEGFGSPDMLVREAAASDVDTLAALAPLLGDQHALAPVFSQAARDEDDEIRTEILEEIAAEEVGDLVGEVDGRVVGNFVVVPVERSEAHAGLARPPGAALLAFAVTAPELRGRGIGLGLTAACFAWARDHGHATMVVDWREGNVRASRFWPRRGFERTFIRLHRLIA